jgi:predicted DNA-binding WGR domain protein
MRQLSFAFLRSGRHTTELPVSVAAPVQPVTLCRVDPSRNMARFYSLEVERDLFGRVVLVRRWGRLGTAGRTRLDEHKGEGEALAALVAMQKAKQRRGYRSTLRP